MKKMVLVCIMAVTMMGLTGCGTATRTTEYWIYNEETGKNELVKTTEEEIDGIFDETVKIKF